MDEEDDDVVLNPGMVIESSKGNYVVMKLLGEGGFGAVYKVCDQKNPLNEYAMKVEKKLKSRRHSKLKMEIAILKVVSQERKQSHFTVIIDRGKKAKFYFVVMELVGSSLASLKMSLPTRMFSLSTAMGASIQCLEACQDLHKYGFIHRDLKPANYACGLGNRRRIVYILDFGIARKILNSKGELKPPREFVRFKGTIRFASIACHRNAEMSPKDDCESWFYMLLDFSAPRGLVWKSVCDKTIVMNLKKDIRTSLKELAFKGVKCKAELIEIMSYLDKLQYHDHVDYGHIYSILTTATKAAGVDLNKPYDWEVGDDPTQIGTIEENAIRAKIMAKKKRQQKFQRRLQKRKESKEKRLGSTTKWQRTVGGALVDQQRQQISKVAKTVGEFATKVAAAENVSKVSKHGETAPKAGEKHRGETSKLVAPETNSTSTSGAFSVGSKQKILRSKKTNRKEISTSSSSDSETRCTSGSDVIQPTNMRNASF